MGMWSKTRVGPVKKTKQVEFTVPKGRVGMLYQKGEPVRFLPEGKHVWPEGEGFEGRLLRVGVPNFFWRRNTDGF